MTPSRTWTGDFTLFGFSAMPFPTGTDRPAIGVPVREVARSDRGSTFFFSTYADAAEDEGGLALKVGFLRDRARGRLTAAGLLQRGLVSQGTAHADEIRGNGLVAHFSKLAPEFTAYSTVLSVPQLFFARFNRGIVCSDRIRVLVDLLDGVELDEKTMPMLFMFRAVYGGRTCYKGIEQMLPGQTLTWKEGEATVRDAGRIAYPPDPEQVVRNVDEAADLVYEVLSRTTVDYTSEVKASGGSLANLLSGGVDSSLIQVALNRDCGLERCPTFSFFSPSQSFRFETEYASEASERLGTVHTFLELRPDDFHVALTEAVQALGMPPLLPSEVGIFAIARYLDKTGVPIRYLTCGQAADTLFGLPLALKVMAVESLSQVPLAARTMKLLGHLLGSLHLGGDGVLERGRKVEAAGDPRSIWAPVNWACVYVGSDRAIAWFGERAVLDALEARRELAQRYVPTSHFLERVLAMDLVTDGHAVASQRQLMALASRREMVHPFLDSDMIDTAFAIDPDVRYVRGRQVKHLLKRNLSKRAELPSVWKRKGATMIHDDVFEWMRSGPLVQVAREMNLPPFAGRRDVEALLKAPDISLWTLLALDALERTVLKGTAPEGPGAANWVPSVLTGTMIPAMN